MPVNAHLLKIQKQVVYVSCREIKAEYMSSHALWFRSKLAK